MTERWKRIVVNARKINCLITAGPTREYLDPVRFLSNPSSGKMGYALASAAVRRGWSVELLSGPVCLAPPHGVSLHSFETGEDLMREVDRRFAGCDILIMAAAVMDYRPLGISLHKIKKTGHPLTVEMNEVGDIVRSVGKRKGDRLVIAFAAETDDLEQYARRKLARKHADFIVANEVGREGVGFGSDTNAVLLISASGDSENIGPDHKEAVAEHLVDRFASSLAERGFASCQAVEG